MYDNTSSEFAISSVPKTTPIGGENSGHNGKYVLIHTSPYLISKKIIFVSTSIKNQTTSPVSLLSFRFKMSPFQKRKKKRKKKYATERTGMTWSYKPHNVLWDFYVSIHTRSNRGKYLFLNYLRRWMVWNQINLQIHFTNNILSSWLKGDALKKAG